MTLTCSVNPSSPGWKYFWYRGKKTSEPLTTQDAFFISNEKISVSQGALYWCRGGRGEPVYYTEYSNSIGIDMIDLNPSLWVRTRLFQGCLFHLTFFYFSYVCPVEQQQTRLLWRCSPAGLRYTIMRWSLLNVKLRMEETLSGSMHGYYPGHTSHIMIRMNTWLEMLSCQTLETTGVWAERKVDSPKQSGVIVSVWRHLTVSHQSKH